MAKERIPNDPYRSSLSDEDFGRQAHLDDELRVLETWIEGRPTADGSRRSDLAGVV